MTNQKLTVRPEYISPNWLRCSDGYTFAGKPPTRLREDSALSSPNLWERVVCVTLQAQSGDFRNVEALLEIIEDGPDVHIRDCSIRVFAQAAPASLVVRLADVFAHPDPDARIEAYSSAVLTCDLRLAEALAKHRVSTKGFERECVMDAISDMLEANIKDLEFAENKLDQAFFERRVMETSRECQQHFGATTAIYWAEPVDVQQLAAAIVELCQGESPEEKGGRIDQIFSILEGMTGASYVGCLDDECSPVLETISSTLNKLHLGGVLRKITPGKRYFFGHPIPDRD